MECIGGIEPETLDPRSTAKETTETKLMGGKGSRCTPIGVLLKSL